MAGIARLSEQQRAALEGIQVGDLIFVQKVVAPIYDDEDGSDRDSEDENDDEDGDAEQDDDAQSDVEDGENDHDDQQHAENATEGEGTATASDDGTSDSAGGNESSDLDTTNASSNTSLSEVYVPPRMYVVSHITTDANGTIIDLQLSHLQYANKTTADSTGDHTYHIYGRNVVHNHPASCVQDCTSVTRIVDIATDEQFRLTVKPSGDIVRYTDPTFRTANPSTPCVASCDDGWLNNHQDLVNMIPDYDPPVLSTGVEVPAALQPPVCPVCIGTELCKKQQELQATFMLTAMIDFGEVVEFLGELNIRRRNELGYSFKQFDEREWGMHFDDMQEEDESEDGGDDDRFEHWAEAMDPSSVSVATRPASAATIAALPRKTLAAAQLAEGTECQVCKEGLEEDSVLIELPCDHVHFHQDCIATWLLQFNTCPDCRKEVPAVAEPEGGMMESTDEGVSGEFQDEDTIMSDE